MSRVTEAHFKIAYNKLYGFLRQRHPEVLEEYRQFLKDVEAKVREALLATEAK